MKRNNLFILTFFCFILIIFTSCGREKFAASKLLKKTNEKELRATIEQFKKASEEINQCCIFENYKPIGKTPEWNEKIQPLMDKISEHHKKYHEDASIREDNKVWNDWIFFKVNSGNEKLMDKYFTKCPFCNDLWDTPNNVPKTFDDTSLYKQILAKKIVKEYLGNLNENEFRNIYYELKDFVNANDVFPINEDLEAVRPSKFDTIIEKYKNLHNKYHDFEEQNRKEFLVFYADSVKEQIKYKWDNYIPSLEEFYTCCPVCRAFVKSSLTGKESTYGSLDIWQEFNLTGLLEKAISSKKYEIQEKIEKESINYLKPFTSMFVRGELGIELKNPKECPSVLYIPAIMEGVAVGEVYIHDATSLKEVWVPGTVKIVAFPNCNNLEKVHLNEGLKIINNFIGCYKLKSIQIPNSVEEIGNWAFLNCTSLEDINLPKSIKTIGSLIFGFLWDWNFFYDDSRYSRYFVDTGPRQEIKRKHLNIIIPNDINRSIFFKKEYYVSFDKSFYSFSNTANYISFSTQAEIRNLGYNGDF